MRHLAAVVVSGCLAASAGGHAQSLTSYIEAPYFTPDGALLGMPGLDAPRFKDRATPWAVKRRPGYQPDTIDVLTKIDRKGRTKPVRAVGVNGDSPADGLRKADRDAAFEVIRYWTFEPGRRKGKPVDVAAIISVPLATDHALTTSRHPLPPDFAPGVHVDRDQGVTPSFCLMSAPPQYGSPEAMKHHTFGTVEIAFVTGEDGLIGATRVTKSLDSKFGLDALSLSSLKSWVFEPALLDGKPVATAATAVMSFNTK
jgi:hypothetical protein